MIKRTVAVLWALAILAWTSPALAQPVNLPANTVWGRLGIGTGPGQAIPFANLTTSLLTPRVNVSDINYAVAVGDTEVAYISISAARTVSLLPAGNYIRGQTVCIRDVSGSASGTNTITAIPSGTNTINGVNANKIVVQGAFGGLCLESDGAGAWTIAVLPNAALSAMAAFTAKCNNTASTATPIDCTVAQLKGFAKIAVSIEDPAFGASPSASASANTTAIQAAINSITVTGASGVLLVPSSNYAVNGGSIAITGPIDIWCAPFSNASGGNLNFNQGGGIGIAVNASFVRISGCYLNRAGTPQAGDDGIAVGTDSVTIADAICTNGSGAVSSASNGFANAAVGMRINLTGCASGAAPLFASITVKTDSGHITVSPGAGATPGVGVAAKFGNVYLEDTFRDVWLVNHLNGIHLIDAAQQHLDHVYAQAKFGALVENQLNPDFGDSFISDSQFLSTDNTNGAALQIISSGGLKISNSKFLFGKYGIWVNWSLGNSANPILSNNSIESFATAGIFITTAAVLSRLDITGGSIAGNAGASGIVVDNTSAALLSNLSISGVTITGNAATTLVDIGKVSGGVVIGNVLDNGAAGTCIALRSNSAAVTALQFANFLKCATGITDAGSGNKTTINLAADVSGLLPFGNFGAKPSFSVTKGGTDQTGIVSATFTALTWPTVVYNVNGNFATNAWTPPAGKVSVFAAYNATGTITAGAQCAIAIFKNGSALRQNLNSCATNDGSANVYMEDIASGSDVYTVQAFITTSASTATVQGAANVTYFGGHWIGP